ncbi:MAG: hypothetical protein DMD31_05270 [Gemmatimonadetes bacterium]|nr:MAG: hypothetical protein DMD31_05270 [Gemmatimonadota bacterium]
MPNQGAESEVECDLNEKEQELDRRISYVHPCLLIEAPGGEDQRFPRQAVLAQALVADRQIVAQMQLHDAAAVLLEGQVVVFATGVREEGRRYRALKAGFGQDHGHSQRVLPVHQNVQPLWRGRFGLQVLVALPPAIGDLLLV